MVGPELFVITMFNFIKLIVEQEQVVNPIKRHYRDNALYKIES